MSQPQPTYYSLRNAYGEQLAQLLEDRPEVVVLSADTVGGTHVDTAVSAYPGRHYGFGIAEQNMVAAAAGMATTGLAPIVNTFGIFGSMRALEMFRTSVCLNRFNVKMVVSHLGIDVGEDGATHQVIEDLAIMRAIPNLSILTPADALELRCQLEWMLDYEGPVYLRTGRSKVPSVLPANYVFEPGHWPVLRKGTDVTLVALQIMVQQALEAAERLEQQGISVQVLNASMIKPLAEDVIMEQLARTHCVVTVEDHNIKGGLGTLVSELVCARVPMVVERVGVNDRFGKSGNVKELFPLFGLSADAIVEKTLRALDRIKT